MPADFFIVHLHPVDRPIAGVLGHLVHARFHHLVALAGHAGHHDIFHGIFHIILERRLLPLAQLHQRAGMGNAGGGADDHRGVVLFADIKGQLGEVLALLAVRGFQ